MPWFDWNSILAFFGLMPIEPTYAQLDPESKKTARQNAYHEIEQKMDTFETKMRKMLTYEEYNDIHAERVRIYKYRSDLTDAYDSLFKLIGWDVENLNRTNPKRNEEVRKVLDQLDVFYTLLFNAPLKITKEPNHNVKCLLTYHERLRNSFRTLVKKKQAAGDS